ncbi:MAG: hypothetical protein HFF18_07770 [Oscillospiraceae bacterium]|nr:hypothetical protein [Oscillospiraceae bacterium]
MTAKFPSGLREKSLKSVRIPVLFVTRQTKILLANPHTPIQSAVPESKKEVPQHGQGWRAYQDHSEML